MHRKKCTIYVYELSLFLASPFPIFQTNASKEKNKPQKKRGPPCNGVCDVCNSFYVKHNFLIKNISEIQLLAKNICHKQSTLQPCRRPLQIITHKYIYTWEVSLQKGLKCFWIDSESLWKSSPFAYEMCHNFFVVRQFLNNSCMQKCNV